MRKTLIAFAVALGAFTGTVQADVLVVPEAPSTGAILAPSRGQSMAEVSRRFGEPAVRHPAKGGGKRVHPPITRWDYPDFAVFFERSTVIDIVVRGVPMPIQNRDELQPASP